MNTKDILDCSDAEEQALLAEWHSRHPEFNDAEWNHAMEELREYLKLAWKVYRESHPKLDLPESL